MQKHLRELLKDPPHLLKNFHYEDVLAFLELGEEIRFVEGDVIIKEDDFVNSAYLIAEGKVSIWKENIQLATLDKRNFMGETFLFSKNNRLAKVSCEEDCILLKYERYMALNYFRKRPEKLFNIFTKNIIEIQQSKISTMNSQLFALKKRILDDKKW
ncbi:MAG: cyclic nucleotide-binding domain-containing protein [Balneolaceae bacterium]